MYFSRTFGHHCCLKWKDKSMLERCCNFMIKYFVLIIYISIYLNYVLDQSCLLIEPPKNAVVNIGETTTFKCRMNSSSVTLAWDYIQAESSSTLYIYNGVRVSKNHTLKYSILTDGHGSHDLVISSMNMSDAGHYRCWAAGSEIKDSAELTVFGNIQIVLILSSTLN